jgi:hypothetical protein
MVLALTGAHKLEVKCEFKKVLMAVLELPARK